MKDQEEKKRELFLEAGNSADTDLGMGVEMVFQELQAVPYS